MKKEFENKLSVRERTVLNLRLQTIVQWNKESDNIFSVFLEENLRQSSPW